jgi:hypothetical protein
MINMWKKTFSRKQGKFYEKLPIYLILKMLEKSINDWGLMYAIQGITESHPIHSLPSSFRMLT